MRSPVNLRLGLVGYYGSEARTKGETGAAKTLCSPFEQPELPEGTLCFASGKPAKKWTYWGRSY
ncbi:hypothetical protein DY000_02061964 [Brassica cretica]|uniref:Proline-tRNA ligase class II C-terminal domain-containing protein n=1 Tax=Brassica cretica TaxID=69181 RepID=A0ABQ7AP71_BRACR|nr:hypothetical protein DY000_02061964 [Brassica cretica]